MSIQAVAQVLDFELADPSAKLILIGIANHTSPTGQCFPSVRLLMRYSGLAESTVREKIRQLEEQELISVQRTPGKSSIYTLTLPLQRPDPTPPKSGGPPLQQPDPNHNRNRKGTASDDARDLPDDWKPKEELRTKLDAAYPDVDIDEQAKLFVLANNSKGTYVAKPDAAFELWMARVRQLKVPPKPRTDAITAGGCPRDPAVLASRAEDQARFQDKLGEWEKAAEQWLDVAKLWLGLHGHNEDARRCADEACKVAKKGSWMHDQAQQFRATNWPEGVTNDD